MIEFSGEILAGGWYPAGWYAALLEAIEIAAARGPEFIPDNATRVMARYYDGEYDRGTDMDAVSARKRFVRTAR